MATSFIYLRRLNAHVTNSAAIEKVAVKSNFFLLKSYKKFVINAIYSSWREFNFGNDQRQ